MSRRAAARLAWTLWVFSLALTALGLFLLTLNRAYPDVSLYYYWLETTLVAVGYSTVGAVVASRMPESFVGWLFCTIGLLFGVIHFCGEYAMYTLVAAPGSLLAGEVAAWIDAWIWVPSLGLIVFLLLVFPDGRLPGALWRRVARFTATIVLAGTVLAAFSPGPALPHPFVNPLGIEALPNIYKPLEALMYADRCGGVIYGSSDASSGRHRAPADQVVCLRYDGVDRRGYPQEHHLSGTWRNMGVVGGIGVHHDRPCRQPSCHGFSDPSLPSLRDRPPYKPHPSLRLAHSCAGSGVCGQRRGAAVRLPDTDRRGVTACGSGIHPGYCDPFHPLKTPHTVVYRPSFLSQQVRCSPHSRSLLR